jgi:hypothetical protein
MVCQATTRFLSGYVCATMAKVRNVAAAFMALALAGGVALPARQAGGLEFVDNRPIVLDLNLSSVGQRWRVSVLDGQPGGGHRLALYVAFQPANVLAVPVNKVSSKQGDVVAFVVELRRRVAGSGELLLSSGGTVVRRPISTTLTGQQTAVYPTSLQFSGIRLMPFSDRLRVSSVVVTRTRADVQTSRGASHVGILTSSRGDQVDVVRRGDEFFVYGAKGAGQYAGSVDLAPGISGGEVDATLRVRDAPVWPLLVLLLGLLAVRALDRYQNRYRKRQLLDLRLARLRERAQAAQRDMHLTFRLSASPGEPGLLLDRQIAAAQAAVGEHATAAELAAWEPDGTAYQRITALVETFEGLSHAFGSLQEERGRTEETFELKDRERGRIAIAASPVGEAMRGRLLESTADLSDATLRLAEARTYLRDLGRLYRRIAGLRAATSPDIRDEAEQLVTKLFTGSANMSAVDSEIDELVRRWKPGSPPPLTTSAQDTAKAPVRPPAGAPPSTAPAPPRHRSRARALAVVAALLLLPFVAFLLVDSGQQADNSTGVGTQTSPAPPAATSSWPTAASALREAPVSTLAIAPPAYVSYLAEPTITDLLWYGAALPMLLAVSVAIAGWWALRLWRRRSAQRVLPFDAASIDRRVRKADRGFTVIGSALVVLGGMSVLYASNPTFGSLGDYLTLGLWAAGFGEGLALIRRFLPLASST